MIELYGHRFSAFSWKPLIAAYARDVPFTFRDIDPDHPDNIARLRELSPTGQMPALTEGGAELVESNVIVEYLDGSGTAPPLIPGDRAMALRARMLADVFDDYVMAPVQRIVAECFRTDQQKDPTGVAQAHEMLDKSYRWLGLRVGSAWAAGPAFTLADCAAAPALFYADWVHPIPEGPLLDYRARVLAHPAVKRVVDEARPYRAFFPLGAPDRD